MRPLTAVLALALVAGPVRAQPALTSRDSVWHLLNRFAWGPAPGQVQAVMTEGALAWLDRQLAVSTTDDPSLVQAHRQRFAVLATRQADFVALFQASQQRQQQAAREGGQPQPPRDPDDPRVRLRSLLTEVPQLMLARAVESDHQVAEVLVDFWFNHFNVFSGKGQVRAYLHSYIEDAIRPHALGRFEALLVATARHPAMLFYLDNAQSVAEGATPPALQRLRQAPGRPGRRPAAAARADSLQRALAQRLPTGINENYARELLELHTLGVDGGYTQGDIEQVARILTGWSIARPAQGAGYVFNAWAHDRGRKVVLGEEFPAGRGEDEGVRLLRMLAAHPATMHHVSAKLCARFVADTPPDGCIDDAVAAWRRSGGEIREVVRAIARSPDFWAPTNMGRKVKSPLEFVASAARALGASADQVPALVQATARLGQPIYGQSAPTGYPETLEDWVNSGALLNRMNLAMGFAGGRLTAAPGAPPLPTASTNPESLVAAINAAIFAGGMSPATQRTIVAELADLTDPRQRGAMALGMALGGPDFQRQ